MPKGIIPAFGLLYMIGCTAVLAVGVGVKVSDDRTVTLMVATIMLIPVYGFIQAVSNGRA